ncbi:heat-inducible transcriptional repressor HrcA [Bombilactobacillus folatiphilus]|uniref:Heat-inducible transcription repressor HrcA n=1 Tax=Bombilactobacillus folatiphilus TaxID=2923362 RepID=A0ABY4P7G6_9LACO|nr:heat-inducible transcriptional repressor HrcA [Bombilactobacillus folatiphilus]UQS81578.1 heat-inducible transcriptional repressor HrcA [Bombilactobacillus folatiphilus]
MITDRQSTILKAIVQQYIETGQPIGSKTLMDRLPIRVSSATIRNDMAALEDEGLIEKIHLSSGRVPSASGYRYYLDHLLEPINVSEQTSEVIHSDFTKQQFNEIDEIVAQSAKILSTLTRYTAIALGPESDNTKLTGFRIVPLSMSQVMAIIVTSDGSVYNKVYRLDSSTSLDRLESVVKIINDQLVGHTLNEVSELLKTDFPQMVAQYLQTPEGFLSIFDDILDKVAEDRFFVDGKSNLFNYVDAHNSDNLKNLYSLFDDNTNLARLLSLKQLEPIDSNDDQGIKVHLGVELAPQLLNDYSLITAKYSVGIHGDGLIALLGPTNMPYSQVIGLITSLRYELAKRLSDYFRELNGDSS